MRSIILAVCSLRLAALLALSGCAAGGSVSPGQISGTAAGLFGVPSATISQQMRAEIMDLAAVAAQLQMLKAQLDGNIAPLPAAPVVIPVPAPTVPTPGGTVPTGPTPNG